MPSKLARPCSVMGCPNRAAPGSSRCAEHAEEYKRASERERPSAAARGYGHRWRAIRARYLKLHPRCEVCGELASELDHIIPIRAGGTNHWDNLQALCKSCHSKKTNRYDGGGWRDKGGQISVTWRRDRRAQSRAHGREMQVRGFDGGEKAETDETEDNSGQSW